MIPLKDNVPTRTFPIITTSLVLVNILVFIWMLTLPSDSVRATFFKFALIPKELMTSISLRQDLIPYNILTIFSSMFLHGGVLHVAGNMLYLWIFGNNVEDVLGHSRFLVFYLLSGLMAAMVQTSVEPTSAIPMIGASGAVSGVLGAYLLLFPWARVKTLIFIVIFITTVDIPAIALLTIWFFMQLLLSRGQGVAWFAHIGGFMFGIITVKVFTIGRNRRRRVLD
jgi:membrane associated rhomboid family serine protease